MSATPSMRDHRIDWLRGLALASIFINHMPGNWLEQWTSRNFGFSDAAEVFVLLAGVAAALAFFRRFQQGETRAVTVKAGRRAVTLYLAHLGATLAAASMFALAAAWYSNPDFLDLIGVAPLFTEPWPGIVGILSGGHQLGYFNILPMYVVLLTLTPALLWLAARSLPAMLGVSVALYLLANLADLNMPNFPTGGAWYFNPFAWQLLFSIGLALGVMRLRRQSIPFHPAAYAVALGYVAYGAVWVLGSLGGDMTYGTAPEFIGTLRKTNLPVSRLAHVLALTYVLIYSPLWPMMAKLTRTNPLAMLGRNSLPVFVTGSLASMAGYIVLVQTGGDVVLETALVGTGLMLMLVCAKISEDGLSGLAQTVRHAGRHAGLRLSAVRDQAPMLDDDTAPTVITNRK
jgi:hypothetical protein